MNEELFGLIVFLLFVLMVGYYIFRYINGDFTIESYVQIDKREYLDGYGGRVTYIVYKITYESGRFKYITKKYYC